MDVAFWMPAFFSIVILGLSKGGLAGIGVVSTPLLAAFMGPLEAAAFILPILVVQDAVAVFHYRRNVDREVLIPLIPGALAGILLAYLFAASVPRWGVEIALGAISSLFALRELLRAATPPPQTNSRLDRAFASLCGAFSGFTSTVAHAGTPGYQIYATSKGLDRDTYAGTSAWFFAVLNLVKLPAFYALGEFSGARLAASVAFAPVAVGASCLGILVVRRLQPRHFRTATNVILLGIGIFMLWRGTVAAGWL